MVARAKRGLLLLEVAVSLVVLGAVLATVAQVIQWSAAEHRAAQRKRCALEATATVLDRLTLLDWSAITSENAAAIHLPAEVAQFLIDPQLNVTIGEEQEGSPTTGSLPRGIAADAKPAPLAKKISVEVSWVNRTGGQREHVRLSTWVFQRRPVK